MSNGPNSMERFSSIYPGAGDETEGSSGDVEMIVGQYRFAPGADTFWTGDGMRTGPNQDGTETETADA